MPFIDAERKEIAFKLVYVGPGMSGKTTNLQAIHRALNPERRGEMVTLDTAEERTLFFDFFPLELGRIQQYAVRFNMYTVPGQTYYEASRRIILDGADGVVFVADSQPGRLEENFQSFEDTQKHLASYDVDLARFPLVLQYNKRDCAGPIAVGTLERKFGLGSAVPVLEAVASQGRGVLDTIKMLSRQVVENFTS